MRQQGELETKTAWAELEGPSPGLPEERTTTLVVVSTTMSILGVVRVLSVIMGSMIVISRVVITSRATPTRIPVLRASNRTPGCG